MDLARELDSAEVMEQELDSAEALDLARELDSAEALDLARELELDLAREEDQQGLE